MSYLSGKKLYLSGAIESDTSCIDWRPPVIKVLSEEFEIDVFNPFSDPKQNRSSELKIAKAMRDWKTVSDIAKAFCRKDLSIVDKSDIVLVRARHDIPSVGTWHETINGWNNKKVVLLVNETGIQNIPIWLFSFIPYNYMFGSWEELYNFLRLINLGKLKEDFRFSTIYNLI